jgi:hypothetical protein
VKLRSALIALAAGALSLALVAPAAAAIDSANDIAPQDIAPAGPGDNGRPDGAGKPDEPGQPDDVGPGSHQPPELPENASPRAEAAVTAAYERFVLISERIDAIRALDAGPERSEALNALFADFGDLIHTVSDAVKAVESEVDGDGDDEGDSDGATLSLDEDPDLDADSDDADDKDHSDDDDDDQKDDDGSDPDEDDDSDDDQDDEDADDKD